MKLRLVREDGSAARLEDLWGVDGTVIDIDGVPCWLSDYEGPPAQRRSWSRGTRIAGMRLGLQYQNFVRDVVDEAQCLRAGYGTWLKTEYDCPFARRAAERRSVACDIEQRRSRERTEYRP